MCGFYSTKRLAENAIGFERAMNFELRKHFYQISGSKKQGIRVHHFMGMSYPSGFLCIGARLHGDYNNDSYIKVYGPHETFVKQTLEIREKWL